MIEKALSHFFQNLPDIPLLLALSGGPDSRALFHLLCRTKCPFHAAHVDHGWRAESLHESKLLERLCAEHQIPFHLKRLEVSQHSGNLEDWWRKQRLDFFKEIVTEHQLGGVVLAHHGDDQAETVLKRLFEGASLPKLRGLRPQISIGGLTLYRPLLGIRKEALLAWLREEGIPYFHDQTNEDPHYLRSRMRHHLLPYLSQTFGKEVSSSLCRIGEAAAELGEFLEELLVPYRQGICTVEKEGEQWITLGFGENPPRSPFLWKAVVRDFFENQSVVISNSNVERVVKHLQKRRAHVQIQIGKKQVKIHNQHLQLIC